MIRAHLTPEQREARLTAYKAVRRALRRGYLVRQPCELCGRAGAAHHRWGYDEPLRVAWLCAMHHGEEHGRIYRQRVFGEKAS